MILGETPAPWEDADKAPALAKRFGHLKGAIMALLNRTPEARPSMAELQHACKRVLSHTTTVPDSTAAGAPLTASEAVSHSGAPPVPEAMHVQSTRADSTSEHASGVPQAEDAEADSIGADVSPMPSKGPRHKFFASPAPSAVADVRTASNTDYSQAGTNAPASDSEVALPSFPVPEMEVMTEYHQGA